MMVRRKQFLIREERDLALPVLATLDGVAFLQFAITQQVAGTMAVSPLVPVIPFIIILIAQKNFGEEVLSSCPTDCICFSEYLSNLESWKWIENDVNVQKDDPLHEDFNPYTEHNEVYDNPKAVLRRLQEPLLATATCILRSNSSATILTTLSALPSLQILSLIQTPGSGVITLEESVFEEMTSLIGLDIQGHSSENAGFLLSPSSLKGLRNLTYLSLDSVIFLQGILENRKTKYEYEFLNKGELPGDDQVIVLRTKASKKGEDEILPYSEYKENKIIAKTKAPVVPEIFVAFTALPLLEHLRISGCNLQDISWDMFYGLDSLKFLLLDQNDLLFLPDFVFYATPHLTALSLSRNRILNLQTVGLAGLLTLQKLDVSQNNITFLSELSLPPFPHLEIADFRDNPIQSIFPNTFEIMNSTKTLFLGSKGTPLEFSPNSFYGLVSLNRLDITNAKADFLEGQMLKGMPQLKSLTMTGSVTRIMYDAFNEVPLLEKLILKQCGILKISMDAFLGLTSLLELDLSHNNLAFLPPGIWEQQLSLREVFLQHNDFKTLPPLLFSRLPAKLIRLEGNPWHCSCNMKYWDSQVTNRVKRYHVPAPNATFCDPQFHKRGSCFEFEGYTPQFEATYVYEKRVSPICQSPLKFKGRSVFEVLRKGLHLCANSLQQNISILLTSSNPTDALEIMGTVRLPMGKNSKENERLFTEKKIKKKVETITTTIPEQEDPSPTAISTTASLDSQTAMNSSSSSPTNSPRNNVDLITSTPTKKRKGGRKWRESEDEMDNRINTIFWAPPQQQMGSKKAQDYVKKRGRKQQQQQG